MTPIDGVSWEESVREFLDIICTDGDGITDQHEEMMIYWVNKIAHDLWEFNGEVGDPTDYLYLAWQGIVTKPGDFSEDCIQYFISENDFNNYFNNYNDNIVDNPTTIKNQNALNDCIDE